MDRSLLHGMTATALLTLGGPLAAQDEGKFYLAEHNGSPTLRIVNADTGVESSPVPLAISNPTDFATSPDGMLFATDSTQLYRVDPQMGTTLLIGNTGLSLVVGLEFDCAGGAYLVTGTGGFASVDLATGVGQLIDTYPNITFSGDIATLGLNEFYASFNSPQGSHIARIEVVAGGTVFTDLGLAVPGADLFGLDFDGFGRLVVSDDSTPVGGLHEILGWGGPGPVTSAPLTTITGLTGPIAGIASVVATGQQVTYCAPATNSCGTTPALTATGVPSASASSGFVITGTNLAGGRPVGLLLSTNGRASVPYGGGTLCVQGPYIVRVMRAGGTPGLCDGQVSIDLNSFMGPAFLDQPGTVVQCQIVGRDTLLPLLTNGLEFSVCQ